MSKQLTVSSFFAVLAMASLALSSGNGSPAHTRPGGDGLQASLGWQAPELPAPALLP